MDILTAVDQFVTQLAANGRSPHTISQYHRHLRQLSEWCRHQTKNDVGEISQHDLAQFLLSPHVIQTADGRPKKATSVNAIRSSLRTFFAFLTDSTAIRKNPAGLIRRARCESARPRILTESEQVQLLGTINASADPAARRDYALFLLLLKTGIRVASAVALDIDDLAPEANELRLRRTKGDRASWVLVPDEALAAIQRHTSDRTSGPMFRGPSGRRITTRQAQRRLALWIEKARLRGSVAPHCLRHTFAVGLLERTGDVVLVKEALGHRSIASTLVYVGCQRNRLRQAVL